MTAYLVALIHIKDPAAYEEYAERFDFVSFTNEYGGEVIVVSDDPQSIEGTWNEGRLIVLKFPDRERAQAWYDSPEYRDVRVIRWAHADSIVAIHDGIDSQVGA